MQLSCNSEREHVFVVVDTERSADCTTGEELWIPCLHSDSVFMLGSSEQAVIFTRDFYKIFSVCIRLDRRQFGGTGDRLCLRNALILLCRSDIHIFISLRMRAVYEITRARGSIHLDLRMGTITSSV